MTYGPPVIKQCEYCKKEYKCANSRASKSRFCTITCHNKSGLLERVEYKCVNCDDKFMARPDHGADRKFCSRKCFLENCVQPIDKECEHCGGMFTATRSSTATRGDGWRLYCSKKCYAEGSRKFEEKPCVHCGGMFYLSRRSACAKNNQPQVCLDWKARRIRGQVHGRTPVGYCQVPRAYADEKRSCNSHKQSTARQQIIESIPVRINGGVR